MRTLFITDHCPPLKVGYGQLCCDVDERPALERQKAESYARPSRGENTQGLPCRIAGEVEVNWFFPAMRYGQRVPLCLHVARQMSLDLGV